MPLTLCNQIVTKTTKRKKNTVNENLTNQKQIFMSTLCSFLHQNPQKCDFSGYFLTLKILPLINAPSLKNVNAPGVFVRGCMVCVAEEMRGIGNENSV